MDSDLLKPPQEPKPDEQQAIDDMSREDLSTEDREALQQLQGELNQDRQSALPEGTPTHVDNQGNALTDAEWQDLQARRQDGGRDEYGQGGSRAQA